MVLPVLAAVFLATATWRLLRRRCSPAVTAVGVAAVFCAIALLLVVLSEWVPRGDQIVVWTFSASLLAIPLVMTAGVVLYAVASLYDAVLGRRT